MRAEYALSVRGLTVVYDDKPVLWDVNLDIPKGMLTAIIGPNGAGKTTLMRVLTGLVKPAAGTVKIMDAAARRGIAYVPQGEDIDWDFPASALDIVLMGRYGKLGWLRRPKKADRQLALEALEKVGMRSLADRQISRLSGGQQQRVFLARALVQQAELYLMDEPFRGVDAQTEKSIVELLKALRDEGKTIVVVHHDLQTAADYFDWVAMINLRVCAAGPISIAFNDDNLREAYGVQSLPLTERQTAARQSHPAFSGDSHFENGVRYDGNNRAAL